MNQSIVPWSREELTRRLISTAPAVVASIAVRSRTDLNGCVHFGKFFGSVTYPKTFSKPALFCPDSTQNLFPEPLPSPSVSLACPPFLGLTENFFCPPAEV